LRNNVAAIVVTYNRKELLLECVDCILKQEGAICDILIIDNASRDGTEQAVKELNNDRIFYYNTGSNIGGAGGFNFGIKKAAELSYEYLWIMDDDCMAHTDALTELHNTAQKLNGEFGFLSSAVLWTDGGICKMNIQKVSLFKKLRDFKSELSPVIMASFVSLFIPLTIVEKIGLPIKEFFIWSDDWEYTRRISREYHKCYFVGNSKVTHKCLSNTGADIVTVSREKVERFRYLFRNDVFLYKREGIFGFFYQFLRLTKWILKTILKSKDNKIYKCGIIIGSTKNGLKFKPEIEYLNRSD